MIAATSLTTRIAKNIEGSTQMDWRIGVKFSRMATEMAKELSGWH